MTSPDLDKTLEQLSSALEKTGKEGGKALVTAARAFSEGVREAREKERAARRAERAEKRRKRREEAIENASVPGGLVALMVATALLIFGVTHSQFWWLLFVALGVGMDGAKQLSMASDRRRRLSAGEQSSRHEEQEPARHEVDMLCDQLLVDLEASPAVVRSFLQSPQKTIEALRGTAKAVDQRRRALGTGDTKHQLEALERQRGELRHKRDSSSDPGARDKFDAALRSLDGQEAALRQLQAAGERLDGEYTSLMMLLQELKTRVAVARSTDQHHVQLEGLQQNVQRLNAELQAITESLQFAAAPIDEHVAGAPEHHSTPTRVRD